jgi:hypothetical protein
MRTITTTRTATTIRTLTLATTLVAIMATTPLIARESNRSTRTPRDIDSPIVRMVKQVMKKVFNVSSNAEVTLPKPPA